MTTSAPVHNARSRLVSGTMTTFIPAAQAAATPVGASSKTSTAAWSWGGLLNFAAAVRKMSGAGLPLVTCEEGDRVGKQAGFGHVGFIL